MHKLNLPAAAQASIKRTLDRAAHAARTLPEGSTQKSAARRALCDIATLDATCNRAGKLLERIERAGHELGSTPTPRRKKKASAKKKTAKKPARKAKR